MGATMIYCPDCGAEVHLSRFCATCGHPLPQQHEEAGSADRRVVSVLFAEVVGLQALEALAEDPEEAAYTISECLQEIASPIYQYGGIVDKFIGNAVIMALFGAPIAHEDDPERAVRAAWDMREVARRFAAEHKLDIALRVGINTGLVIAGAVGGAEKRDYTVMGDAVNLAQRLEANCKPDAIWINRETANHSRRAFTFDELPPLAVKGRAEPITAYAVVLQNAEASHELAGRLVGRKLEQSRLAVLIEAARGKTPQGVVLRGEIGLGKTALLSSLNLAGFRVWRGQCRSYEADMPMALARRVLGSSPLSPEPEGEDAELLRWIRDGVLPKGSALAVLTGDQLAARAADALVDLILARKPLAILVEDLQWLDDGSRLWIDRLIDRFRSPESDGFGVFFVLSGRQSARLPDLSETTLDQTTFRLGPLSREAAIELAAGMLVLESAPGTWPTGVSDLLERAIQRADGNPRLLTDLIGDLIQTGVLAREEAGWKATRQPGVVPLPATIQAAVRARLDRLADPGRKALRGAAVAGRQFSPALVEALEGPVAADQGLDELIDAGIVGPRSDTMTFRQDLLREVAYDSLLVRDRRELHAKAAGYLMLRDLGRPNSTVALHLVAAEDWAGAAAMLWGISQQAQNAGQRGTAEKWLLLTLQALDHTPTAPGAPSIASVFLALGVLQAEAGDHDHARAALSRALESAPESLEAAGARLSLAEIAERQGDYDTATRWLTETLAEVPPEQGALRGKALSKLALIRFRTGEFDGCDQLLTEAALAAKDDPDTDGFASSLRGLLQYRRGDLTEAIASHEQALAFRRQNGNLPGVGMSLNNLAVARMEAGDLEGSLRDSYEGIAVARRIGDRVMLSMLLLNLGAWELEKGECGRAAEHLRAALELKLRLRDAAGAATCRVTLGEALVAHGDPDQGLALIAQGVGDLDRLGAREVLPAAYTAWGRALLATGKASEASEILDKALGLSIAVGAKGQETEIAKLLARAKG